MTKSPVNPTDVKAVVAEVIVDLEKIVEFIDTHISNNPNFDKKSQQIGPYISDEIQKVLFSARTFSR